VVDIGLSRAEFWCLTPRQFWNLYDRYVAREIRHAREGAQLTALYAEMHRDKDKRKQPFTIDDFAAPMPGTKPAKKDGLYQQSGMDQLAAMQLAHELISAKGAPTGSFGRLSPEEREALYAERHKLYGKVQ
jgi:hypothetical protein